MRKILSKFKRDDHRDVDAIFGSKDTWLGWQYHYPTSIPLSETKKHQYWYISFRSSSPLPIPTNASYQGSWFVLERWIADSPFQHAFQPAQSDLDIARGINAKQVLVRHWDTWMTEEDWVWISERGINTVRIPVSCFLLMSSWPVPFYLNFHRLATIISVELILLFFMVQSESWPLSNDNATACSP